MYDERCGNYGGGTAPFGRSINCLGCVPLSPDTVPRRRGSMETVFGAPFRRDGEGGCQQRLLELTKLTPYNNLLTFQSMTTLSLSSSLRARDDSKCRKFRKFMPLRWET